MSASGLQAISDAANWTGSDLVKDLSWRFELNPREVVHLRAMAERCRPKTANELLQRERFDFDLGPFQNTLDRVFKELKSGLGIALIRGLPVEDMDRLDLASIYWAIGVYLGQATPNNPEGDMFGHITDLGKTQLDPNSRGYQTRELMDYHCDQCDVVGLLCLRAARSGGTSMVASSVAMYNTLLAREPELAQALTQPMIWTKHGEFSEGDKPYYESPVFNFKDGRLSTSFGPKHIEKGHKLPGVPDLSDTQRAAIRLAEEIAHEQRFEMELQPGDMQFANNYVTLHTRSAFEDHDDPAKKRLLWRLWLMTPDLRHRTAYSMQWQSGVTLGAGRQQIRV